MSNENEDIEEGTSEEIDFDNLEEDVDDNGNRKPDSFISIVADFASNLNYKLLIILFLSYIFLMSDLFLDKVLSKITDATKHRDQLTPKGTLINGLLLIMLYMTADLLISSGVV